MPLLTLNLSCENMKYPAREHFEKTNTWHQMSLLRPGVIKQHKPKILGGTIYSKISLIWPPMRPTKKVNLAKW